ncbi:hypothetical protein GCM10009731_65540 [Streptomyces globosus]
MADPEAAGQRSFRIEHVCGRPASRLRDSGRAAGSAPGVGWRGLGGLFRRACYGMVSTRRCSLAWGKLFGSAPSARSKRFLRTARGPEEGRGGLVQVRSEARTAVAVAARVMTVAKVVAARVRAAG